MYLTVPAARLSQRAPRWAPIPFAEATWNRRLLRSRLCTQPSARETRKGQTVTPVAPSKGGQGVRSVHATDAEACLVHLTELLHRKRQGIPALSRQRPLPSANTLTGTGREGPWMGLQVFDKGGQKPVPASRRVISPARAMIQKMIPRFENRRIARTPVGLVYVERRK